MVDGGGARRKAGRLLAWGTAVAVLALGACGSDEDALARGDRLWADSSFPAALAEYRLALRHRDVDPAVLVRVAHAYVVTGNLASAASRSDPSIHVSPSDHFVQERPRRGIRLGNIPLVAVLIGIAVFLWVYHEDANKTLATWTRAITPPPPTSAEQVITPQSEEKATSPALSSQLEELTREVADMRNNVQQFAAKQEQLNRNAEPARSEQEIKEARLNPASQPQPRLASVPETPPSTIPGWIVHEVASGTAVVQGPNGTWRVARGDVLPGAGRVDSIVRWGNRWIVSTNRGLISTP